MFLGIVPLFVVGVLYAAGLKLSARILRFRGVSWGQAFLFALLVVVVSAVGRFFAPFLGIDLPLPAGLALGVGVQLGLAAWYFRDRLAGSGGASPGWLGGVKLCGLALVFVALAGLLLSSVVEFLLPGSWN